jgi:hypothetical protein
LYLTIIEIRNTIITSIVGQVKRSIELATIVYIIDRIIKGRDALTQLTSPNKIIWLKSNNIDIRILLNQKYII